MSDYARKINALLAKAASTTSEAERETFTEAAERLMVKWGVDEAMLSDAELRSKERAQAKVEQRRYRIEGGSAALLAELVAARAARGVGTVRTLISRTTPYWWAVGFADDLARAELYVPFITEQARAAWKLRLKSYYFDAADRVAFFDSFGWAVHGRLAEMFAREAANTTGAELVLSGRLERVDEYVDGLTLRPAARPRQIRGESASRDGWRAGMDATLAAGALQ